MSTYTLLTDRACKEKLQGFKQNTIFPRWTKHKYQSTNAIQGSLQHERVGREGGGVGAGGWIWCQVLVQTPKDVYSEL